jgi:cupin fold WbuC family metalloprotein
MKVVTDETLIQLSGEARGLARQRKNYNLHPANESCCHRLFNAVEPAAYIRPHRHLDTEKDEAFVLIRGRLGVITFSDQGEVTESAILSRQNGILAADVPHGTYHTAVSLESGTVFFEAKAGPYLPMGTSEYAPWAPAEGSSEAEQYLEHLKTALVA